MTVQKLWYSIYYSPFTASCVFYDTLSLTPDDQNLCQIVSKIDTASAEQFVKTFLFINFILQLNRVHWCRYQESDNWNFVHLCRKLTISRCPRVKASTSCFSLITWEGVSGTLRYGTVQPKNLSLKLQLGYWDLVHWRTLLAAAERFVGVGCSLITSLCWTNSILSLFSFWIVETRGLLAWGYGSVAVFLTPKVDEVGTHAVLLTPAASHEEKRQKKSEAVRIMRWKALLTFQRGWHVQRENKRNKIMFCTSWTYLKALSTRWICPWKWYQSKRMN